MGLRLNTNVNALTSLRHLDYSDRLQTSSLKKLASGDAIAEDSYDPSGLVISEKLRAQAGSLQQARENTEFASHIVSTADSALSDVYDLLNTIRGSLLAAMNTGGSSDEQIRAEQDAVDEAVRSIDRIAASTRFGNNNLLNGAASIRGINVSSDISELAVRSVALNGADERTFSVKISSAAERASITAQLDPATGTADGDQVVRVTGAVGTQEIFVNDGATTQDLMKLINAHRDETGVFATLLSGSWGSPAAGDELLLQSDGYGSNQQISLAVVSGDSVFAAANEGSTPAQVAAGGVVSDTGADVQAVINGMNVKTVGNEITVKSGQLDARIRLADGTGPGASPLQFTAVKSGFTFQLHTGTSDYESVTIGLANMGGASLGMPETTLGGTGAGTPYDAMPLGGYLSSLISGGANDLTTNPGNGLRIVDAALGDVSEQRSFLGALQADVLDSNMNSLDVAFQNIAGSESQVRDLDYATESAEFTRRQVNAQAGISVVASSNLISKTVLTLLQ
jgi:flagellin